MRQLIIIGLLVLLGSCEEQNLPPAASIEVNTHVGYIGRVFTFSASKSTDPDNDPLGLRCRWDFESDGNWDTPYSLIREVNHSFPASGRFLIVAEIIDPGGLTSKASDTVDIFGPFPDSAMTDPRDNQVYRIVKIKDIWFMAENLRYGNMILSEQEQTNNQVVEYYSIGNNPDNLKKSGGLYAWNEAMNWKILTNNQGICPPGWRIPNTKDLEKININVNHAFIADYYGDGGLSGVNIAGGYYKRVIVPYERDPGVSYFGLPEWGFAAYWMSNYSYSSYSNRDGFGHFYFNNEISSQTTNQKGIPWRYVYYERNENVEGNQLWYFPVRCVSDRF